MYNDAVGTATRSVWGPSTGRFDAVVRCAPRVIQSERPARLRWERSGRWTGPGGLSLTLPIVLRPHATAAAESEYVPIPGLVRIGFRLEHYAAFEIRVSPASGR